MGTSPAIFSGFILERPRVFFSLLPCLIDALVSMFIFSGHFSYANYLSEPGHHHQSMFIVIWNFYIHLSQFVFLFLSFRMLDVFVWLAINLVVVLVVVGSCLNLTRSNIDGKFFSLSLSRFSSLSCLFYSL